VGGERAKRPRERHDGFTAARKKAFLEALGKHGTIADACRIAGVSRRTFYYHRDRWADFAAACEGQLARAAGAVETLAWERATVGAEEVTIRGGEVVQVKRKPSDAMLRLLLQASNPRKYGRMAAARRKAIEREVRAKMLGEGRGRMPPVATDAEVRDALVRALEAHGLRRRAAGQPEGAADGRGDDTAPEA
jgi:AcrR family transcriptional regulator